MLKKILLTTLALVVVIGAIAGVKIMQIKALIAAGAHYAPPPEPVTTAVVTSENWVPTIPAVGSLTAIQGVTVSAQLDGNVTGITFKPGSKVKAGDLLVQQDISVEQSQLRAAEAAAELARLNLQRSQELLESKTISQAQFDSDNANFQQAIAQADNIRATIAKKTIRAPFTGRLAIRLINLGQTLKAGDAIVSLQALDPIYADFYLPQQELGRISAGQAVELTSESLAGAKVLGQITAISPDVDSATRNVRVEATVANADERLHPGMFVDVSVELPAKDKVLVIPATSVLYAPYGDSVFVVEEKKDDKTGQVTKTVRQQFVRLGVARGDFVAVTSGLKEGEVIVTTGAFKLHNGGTVIVNNSLAPAAELAPKPTDS
jgi:membrane fusion protein (multidrug efflux system)